VLHSNSYVNIEVLKQACYPSIQVNLLSPIVFKKNCVHLNSHGMMSMKIISYDVIDLLDCIFKPISFIDHHICCFMFQRFTIYKHFHSSKGLMLNVEILIWSHIIEV
jgi:hypothetical protein